MRPVLASQRTTATETLRSRVFWSRSSLVPPPNPLDRRAAAGYFNSRACRAQSFPNQREDPGTSLAGAGPATTLRRNPMADKDAAEGAALGARETHPTLSLVARLVLWGMLISTATAVQLFFPAVPVVQLAAALVIFQISRFVKSHVLEFCLNIDLEITTALFLRRVAEVVTIALPAIPLLSSLGVPTTSLTAILTSFSLALGLATQKYIGDMASGILLMIFQPFKVGDKVKIGDITGFVSDVLLSETHLDTDSNVRVRLPNSDIYSKSVQNLSRNKAVRVEVEFAVAISADIKATREAIMGALQKFEEDMPGPDAEKAKPKAAKPKGKKAGGVLRALDADHDGVVSASEMLLGAKTALQRIRSWHLHGGVVKGIHDALQELDEDGDGHLTLSEIFDLTKKQVQLASLGAKHREDLRRAHMSRRQPRKPSVVMIDMNHWHTKWQAQVWVSWERHDEVSRLILEDIALALREKGLI